MKKFALALLSCSLLSAAVSTSVFAGHHGSKEEGKPEITFKTVNVGNNLNMLIGQGGFAGGNILVSNGNDGVVMIDGSMPHMLDKLNVAVSQITEKTVDFMINTHVHGDHTGNNESISTKGTHIIGHDNLRTAMLKKDAAGKGLPIITFPDSMTLHLNDHTIHAFHVSAAHTDSDLAIYFKEANVLHTGDAFFNERFPFIDLETGGTIAGYIAAQKKLLEMADSKTKIIPGHGSLATKANLSSALLMLEDSAKIISEAIAKGLSEDDVVKTNPLKKYDSLSWGFISTEKMTRQLYKGLK